MAEEAPLLARCEWNAEVEELRRDERQGWRFADLLLDSRGRGSDERARRRDRLVSRDRKPGAPGSPETVQYHDRDRGARERRRRREPLGAGAAVRAGVGGHENERSLGQRIRPELLGREPRASSTSAAVPEALSPTGCPVPALSR